MTDLFCLHLYAFKTNNTQITAIDLTLSIIGISSGILELIGNAK